MQKAAADSFLICTAGEGWYQEENKPPVSLSAGTVVTILPGVKHWHGAKRKTAGFLILRQRCRERIPLMNGASL